MCVLYNKIFFVTINLSSHELSCDQNHSGEEKRRERERSPKRPGFVCAVKTDNLCGVTGILRILGGSWAVVVHTFNPSILEAEVGGSL